MTSTATSTPLPEAPVWSITRGGTEADDNQSIGFTSDDVINAYIRGRKDGLSAKERAVYNQIQSNVVKSAEDVEKLIQLLQKMGFSPTSAHLKINSIDCLEVLVTVPESDFLSDNFSKVYEYLYGFEAANASEDFTIHYSFVDHTGNLNLETITSEGYIFSHDVKAGRASQA